jgi:hypothetical protein
LSLGRRGIGGCADDGPVVLLQNTAQRRGPARLRKF